MNICSVLLSGPVRQERHDGPGTRDDGRMDRAWVLVLAGCAGCSLLPKDNPYPSYVISPGVKIAYTFGPHGGWTYGGEISVPIKHGDDLHAIVAIGPALNFAWTARGTSYVRLGVEAVSWFVGVEGGPTLVNDHRGNHFGIAVSPWASAIWAVGEYTYTYVVGAPDFDEVGVIAKLPICIVCAGAGGGDSDYFG